MEYKSILLHIVDTEACRERLKLCIEIARALDAAVIGVGARSSARMPDPIGLSGKMLDEAIATELADAERVFTAETAGLRSRTWRAAAEEPEKVLLDNASGADLIVVGHVLDNQPSETRADPRALVVKSGLPVLMVPPNATTPLGRRAAIAWDNVREARRAVWDALPFLKRAERVDVVHIASDGGASTDDQRMLVDRLRLHGVEASLGAPTRGKGSDGEQILQAAEGAGLIVAGGYGHARLQERFVGGVSETLLRHAPVCTLFSH